MNTAKPSCAGRRRSGYWKGYPCGASPTVRTVDGKWFCRNHMPLASFAEEGTRYPRRTRKSNT